jgi:S1-C subfamily serine protease
VTARGSATTRSRRTRVELAVAGALLVVTGCSGSGGDRATPTTRAEPAVVDGKAVLARYGPAVALIETPIGSGSGVLVEDGYLVTSAHVVDPFDRVDVTFEGEDADLDVAVLGVDLEADLALVGPLPASTTEGRTAMTVEPADHVERGSDVYLVGFPGDQDEPEATIVRGILSRHRALADWDIDLLQSDAKIGFGQSGGALVDERGRLVGITGLADDDGYALAVSGSDVKARMARIRGGHDSGWEPVPREASTHEAAFTVADRGDARMLYFPATDDDRRLKVTVAGPDALVELDDVDLTTLDLNQVAHDVDRALDPEGAADLPEPVAPGPDGSYTFDLEAGYPALLAVGSVRPGGAAISVTASEPFTVVRGDPRPATIEVGDTATGAVAGYGMEPFDLSLEAGDTVELTAASATGDLALTILGPGVDPAHAPAFDDGGGGIFDLDATGTFTAPQTGVYRIRLYPADVISTSYRLTVTAA